MIHQALCLPYVISAHVTEATMDEVRVGANAREEQIQVYPQKEEEPYSRNRLGFSSHLRLKLSKAH